MKSNLISNGGSHIGSREIRCPHCGSKPGKIPRDKISTKALQELEKNNHLHLLMHCDVCNSPFLVDKMLALFENKNPIWYNPYSLFFKTKHEGAFSRENRKANFSKMDKKIFKMVEVGMADMCKTNKEKYKELLISFIKQLYPKGAIYLN